MKTFFCSVSIAEQMDLKAQYFCTVNEDEDDNADAV